MQIQLRVYMIVPGELARFEQEWRDGIVPLRRAHGFDVAGAWSSDETSTFTWLLTYAGDDPAAADARYVAARARGELDPDPARLIAKIVSTELVRAVDAP